MASADMTIGVLIPTYNRPWIVKKTIELLKQNLRYSGKKWLKIR